MKQTFIFAAVLVVAMAASLESVQKRNAFQNLLDKLHVLVDTTTLKNDLQTMLDDLGSDPSEQKCEQEGHKLISGLLEHSVPLICHSFQELIHHFRIVPLTDPALGKRFFLDSINADVLKQDLQMIVDTIGSDPSEQLCEQEVHKLFGQGLLSHSAPLLCHSFQNLVQKYSITPTSKRFVMDDLMNLFDLTTLKADLQIMLDVLGSDPTEQSCEQEGHKLTGTGLLSHSVPLICHSFQELIHHFNLHPDTTTVASAKRFVIDQLNADVLKKDLQMIVDVLGSDPTEQACEAEVHKLFGQGLLSHGAPLLCHSFQNLIQKYGITPSSSKRFVLDDILKTFDLTTLKADLQTMLDVLGSDPTEQSCEQEGHKLTGDGLLFHSVPLICHSFQELIHHFNIHPDPMTTAAVVSA